ncbi:MAG: hypothetical protein ACRDPY_35200 [Streptosporangiaceae bacterium]
MLPLTAVMPDVEVPRSDVVAARIARKVAPLFGVAWEQSPFDRTWVCDFGTITLAEIARGAPFPPRHVQSAMDEEAARVKSPAGNGPAGHAPPGPPWQPADRAVWTFQRAPTPTAIAHATLNRYGPDTKAAVVLTGANRLLQDVTAAVASVCEQMAAGGTGVEARLAVWAGLIFEAFRGQPALVAAAIQARAIQRALTTPWGEHLWLPGLGKSARCEFGATTHEPGSPGPDAHDAQSPTRFDLIDSTLPLLGLPIPIEDGPLLSHRDVLDDIAARCCLRLMQVGHPGRGITWVSELAPGHRSVQTYLRVGSAVAPFVAEVFSMLGFPDRPGSRVDAGEVSRLLAGTDFGRLTRPARRAHLVSAHALASYLRFHDHLLQAQPELRAATRALTGSAAVAAAKCLGSDDPVTLLLDAYTAYCTAWDLSRDAAVDGRHRVGVATDLGRQLGRVTDAWQAGALDPGTASYLLEVGVMALDRLHATGTDPAGLAGFWRHAMLARAVDPDRDLDEPLTLPDAHCYHLQNYAAFQASRATGATDLRRALAVQRACVRIRDLVTHGELAEYDAKFTSARTSRQTAAAIVGKLLESTDPRQAPDYRDLLAEGVGHARAAIENPTTRAMLAGDGAGLDLVRLTVAALPAVIAAREWDLREAGNDPLVGEDLIDAADRLLGAVADAAGRPAQAVSEQDRDALADLVRRHASLVPAARGV